VIKGGENLVVSNAETAYDFGVRKALREGVDEERCHKLGILQQFSSFYQMGERKLKEKYPSYCNVRLDEPMSFYHEVVPFLVAATYEDGKMAMAYYQAWLWYGKLDDPKGCSQSRSYLQPRGLNVSTIGFYFIRNSH
jgi:hypothetical protein